MAYHDDLRNPRTNPVPGTPLGYDTRPTGGSGGAGLVLAAVALVLVIAAFVFGAGGSDGDQPAVEQQAAPTAVAPAGDAAPALPGTGPDGETTPAPAAPAPAE